MRRDRWTDPARDLAARLSGLLLAFVLASLAAGDVALARAKPVHVAVLVSSDRNRCYDPATVLAIRHFAATEAARLAREPATSAHPLKVTFYDDYEEPGATVANLRRALADPRLVAIVGLSSSARAKAALAALGPELRAAGVPFLSEISLNGLFADQPAVYSMASTVDNEVAVVKRLVRERGFQRPAFVGLTGDDYAAALGDGLASGGEALPLVADLRRPLAGTALAEADVAAIVAELRAKGPDVLLLAVQSGPGAQILRALQAAGLELPAVVLYGRVRRILDLAGPAGQSAHLLELGREGVPNVYNERLQRQIWRTGGAGWIFQDTPNRSAAGWSDGTCKLTPTSGPPRLLDDANRRAIGRGAQYADMLALLAEAMAPAPAEASLPELRAAVLARLARLAAGEAVHHGLWQDWSFAANRASSSAILVLERRPGARSLALAPTQYHHAGPSLLAMPAVGFSLDLIGLADIDSNARSFAAELYLSLRSPDPALDITAIEFTNALRSPADQRRLVAWQLIHDGSAGSRFPEGTKVYKVSGRFEFAPELATYPFDTQRLSISFQPASASRPFLVQPAPPLASGERASVDGWDLLDGYVGSDQDVIPTLEAGTGNPRVVSFYKFNQTWIVKRQTVDFTLRVVVPLAFILLVTWFSVFLGEARFESIMGMQVTALLSAIALYLALPKVASGEATLSDRVFMATYAAVSLMIGLSVLKDSGFARRRLVLHRTLTGLQTAGFPLLTLALIGGLMAASR